MADWCNILHKVMPRRAARSCSHTTLKMLAGAPVVDLYFVGLRLQSTLQLVVRSRAGRASSNSSGPTTSGRYTREAQKWDQPSSQRPFPRRSRRPAPPSRVAVRMSRQPATKARFNLPSGSFRRDPCRRRAAFHFVTACPGSPSRWASARPRFGRVRASQVGITVR